MPKTLAYHEMVSSGHDLIVIGGDSRNDTTGYSDSLYKLSCSNYAVSNSSTSCKWETLKYRLQTKRNKFVAIPVPDDFVACN